MDGLIALLSLVAFAFALAIQTSDAAVDYVIASADCCIIIVIIIWFCCCTPVADSEIRNV